MVKEVGNYTESLNEIINSLQYVNENARIEQILKEIVAELETIVEKEYFSEDEDKDKTKEIVLPQSHEGEVMPNTYRICYHQALINVAIRKGYPIENIVNIIESNEPDTTYLNGETSGVPNTIKNINDITNLGNLASGEFLRSALVNANGMDLTAGDVNGINMIVSLNSSGETIYSTPEQEENYAYNISKEGMVARDEGMISVSNKFFADAAASGEKYLAIFPVGASHEISNKIEFGDGVIYTDERFLGEYNSYLGTTIYDFYVDNEELREKIIDVSDYIDSEPRLDRDGNPKGGKEKGLRGAINEERLVEVLDILASTRPNPPENEIKIDRSRG